MLRAAAVDDAAKAGTFDGTYVSRAAHSPKPGAAVVRRATGRYLNAFHRRLATREGASTDVDDGRPLYVLDVVRETTGTPRGRRRGTLADPPRGLSTPSMRPGPLQDISSATQPPRGGVLWVLIGTAGTAPWATPATSAVTVTTRAKAPPPREGGVPAHAGKHGTFRGRIAHGERSSVSGAAAPFPDAGRAVVPHCF